MSGASDNYEMWRLSNILINKAREYKGLPPRPDKNPYKPPQTRILEGVSNINKRQRKIVDAWNALEELSPDITTERLFAMVEDETGADAADIAIALYIWNEENNK